MKYSTFCAANSGDGFISFFDTIINEKNNKVYFLKGGPGCGKSTLLKQIQALSNNAEIIHCSGDPDSLDGVILSDKRTVIIDATNPHSFEPVYPGICGNIVDLGEGWDPTKLNATKIINLTEQKKLLYKKCYKLLSGIKKIHESVFAPLCNEINKDAVKKLIKKLFSQNALSRYSANDNVTDCRFISCISPNGLITFNQTIESLGKNVIMLKDRWMIGPYILQLLDKELSNQKIYHINCYHPLLGKNTLQHILIPQSNLSIITSNSLFETKLSEDLIVKTISTSNFLDKNHINSNKNKLSFITKEEKELLTIECDTLHQAKDIHLEIENEYIKGTDFNATKHLKEKLIHNIFYQT